MTRYFAEVMQALVLHYCQIHKVVLPSLSVFTAALGHMQINHTAMPSW